MSAVDETEAEIARTIGDAVADDIEAMARGIEARGADHSGALVVAVAGVACVLGKVAVSIGALADVVSKRSR